MDTIRLENNSEKNKKKMKSLKKKLINLKLKIV
jgi:hypothetical protein